MLSYYILFLIVRICNFLCFIFFLIQMGYTAVHQAAAHGHLQVIQLLTEFGCFLDTQDLVVRFVI